MSQHTYTSTDEVRPYATARLGLCLVLMTLLPVFLYGPGRGHLVSYLGLIAAFAALTALIVTMLRRGRFDPVRTLRLLLIPDLLILAGFTAVFTEIGGDFYAVVMALPITYALMLSSRDAGIAGVGAGLVYVGARVYANTPAHADIWLLIAGGLAVPAVATFVAGSVTRGRRRQAQTARLLQEKSELAHELEHRVAELEAIQEVTESIHTSVNMRELGDAVVSILGELLGMDTLALLVIDDETGASRFSASMKGPGSPDPDIRLGDDGRPVHSDTLACRAILHKHRATVLLCGMAEAVEAMTSADRSLLSIVANELLVAVENMQLLELTSHLAVTDELTGLYNYRHLQSHIEGEVERANRYGKPLSVMMIDVDDFKRFNDEYGHVAGDGVLGEIAMIMRATIREADFAARYGGEEFSILLPETDADGACVAAEKLRDATAAHLFVNQAGERVVPLTVSIGVATYPTHATDKESLMRAADDALYAAKASGKNQVVRAESVGGDSSDDGSRTARGEDIGDDEDDPVAEQDKDGSIA